MELSQAIAARRSIRAFKDLPVADTQLMEMLDAARLSPSSKNLQPWKYVILRNEQKDLVAARMEQAYAAAKGPEREQISSVPESCAVIRRAPVLILVGLRRSSGFPRSDYLSLGASMENMCLKALELGLGCLWICDVDIAAGEIRQALGLEYDIVSALAAGYPDEAPEQRPRLPVSEISEWVPDSGQRNNIRSVQASPTGNKYVFISYSHKDKAVVDADIAELKRHGVPVWIDDSMMAGTEWNRVALKRIADENCVCVIFYLSPNSLCSEAVAKELKAVVKRFGRPDPVDRTALEPIKGFFSVNIGIQAPASAYASLRGAGQRVSRRLQKLFTKTFPDHLKYIRRSGEMQDYSHMEEMLDVLEMYDVITPGVYDTFTYEVLPEREIRITSYTGRAEVVAVTDRISGMPVTEIGANAFCGNPEITSVYIPDSVHTVGDGAFLGLTRLTNVRLPKRMRHLGVALFRGTSSLSTVALPAGPEELGEAAFRESGITEIDIPEGVRRLGEAVFLGCTRLRRVTMPESVEEMTEGGFKQCPALESLTAPRTLRGLNAASFSDCPHVDIVIGGYHYHNGTADPVD